MSRQVTLSAAALFALTSPALAHMDPAAHGSFLAGLSHPLSGIDHVLAMVAVGLWAALVGGNALWAIPAAFVGMMAVGYGVSLSGVPLPFVEPAILASVVVLGLFVAATIRPPAWAGAAIVGLFAVFHGHAHGGEIGAATALGYGVGFAAATAALHLGGIALGAVLRSEGRAGRAAARLFGAATAVAGLALMLG